MNRSNLNTALMVFFPLYFMLKIEFRNVSNWLFPKSYTAAILFEFKHYCTYQIYFHKQSLELNLETKYYGQL
jgi:hypothetical protein